MARRGVGETKKHLARAERERIQRRWILTGTIAVAAVVMIVLGYGLYDSLFVQPYQTVAEVDGVDITSGEFSGRVRLIQRELLSQLNSYIQMETFFGGDPQILQELRNLEMQIQTQLANPEVLGRDVLDSMILQRILIEQAELQGISVSEQELEREIQRNFNFYPEGTPTSAPTSTALATFTPDPTIAAQATPTTTVTPGPSPTNRPTSTPRATATPYTLNAFQEDYKVFVDSLSDFRISEDDFVSFIEIGLLEEKLRENYVADIETEQEQVLVRVLLAESEDAANEVVDRLDSGEDWDELVIEYSQDISTRDFGGDVGWNTISDLLQRFGQPGIAAFAGEVDSIVGPLPAETEEFYIFRVDGREQRPISDEAFQLARDQAFDQWLQGLLEEAEVVIAEDWQQYLPPAVPTNF
jgi:parvulin-like peptidyl-prolyl isomerase